METSVAVLSGHDSGDRAMTEGDKETLLRAYAAGEITWWALRERGFEDYVQVLGGLGELGLRPPIAPMDGPNVAARQRGLALLRKAMTAPPA